MPRFPRALLCALLFSAGLGGRAPAAAQAPAFAAAPLAMARFVVSFGRDVPIDRQNALVKELGGAALKSLWLVNALVVETPAARAASFGSSAASLPEVRGVESDLPQNWIALTLSEQGNTPWASDAKGGKQQIPWGVMRVNAPKAWKASRGGGVKVAVLDTGIDDRHPDLKVLGGFNALTPRRILPDAPPWRDDNGHGTHVAGTIAALDNGIGVVGVAPDAELYAVKVLDSQGSGSFSDIVMGLQWCVENGMDLVNVSLGSSFDGQVQRDAVEAAAQAGLTIVAAAGNNGGGTIYPAAYSHVISVSALEPTAKKTADFSSRGPEIDVAAPGVKIPSTLQLPFSPNPRDEEYATMSGTSMASPHVTGLAALAMAARGIRGSEALRRALRAAAVKIPGIADEEQGAGLVDAEKLVFPQKAKK